MTNDTTPCTCIRYDQATGTEVRFFEQFRRVQGSTLPPLTRWILTLLLDRMDASGECAYAIRWLVKDSGCGENTVRRALHSLIDLGWLAVESRYLPSGRQAVNHYTLTQPADVPAYPPTVAPSLPSHSGTLPTAAPSLPCQSGTPPTLPQRDPSTLRALPLDQEQELRAFDQDQNLSQDQDQEHCAKSAKSATALVETAHKAIAPTGARHSPNGSFATFWETYPVKRGKKTAQAVWQKKKLDRLAPTLIADVEARKIDDNQWQRGFIPHPTTYLRQERWEDELVTIEARPTTHHDMHPERRNDRSIKLLEAEILAEEQGRTIPGEILANDESEVCGSLDILRLFQPR